MIKNVVDAGGSIYMELQHHEWMYGYSFVDLNGH